MSKTYPLQSNGLLRPDSIRAEMAAAVKHFSGPPALPRRVAGSLHIVTSEYLKELVVTATKSVSDAPAIFISALPSDLAKIYNTEYDRGRTAKY